MLTPSERRLLNTIGNRQDQIVGLLRELVHFKTVVPSGDGPVDHDEFKEFQALTAATLGGMGFGLDEWEVDVAELEDFPGSGVNAARDLSNMPVVVGKLPGGGKGRSLILNGHCDVVSPGLEENWRYPPFAGYIEDGRLYGRGAVDMKGGIAAMLEAVRSIQLSGIQLAGDLIVQVVPDEEASCMGTLSCCQRGYAADAAIIPEPTGLKVLVAMRGSLSGIITVPGRAGHAELTQPHWTEGGAVNAISKAVKVLVALDELTEEWRSRPDKQHRFLDPDIIVPTMIQGGEWAVTYPESVDITFDSTFLPGATGKREEIEEKLRQVSDSDAWLKGHPPTLRDADVWFYGAEVDESEPIVQTAVGVLGELGIEPALAGMGSLTDAIHLINYARIPTISIGPSDQTAHSADEHIAIGELVDTTRALALAIVRWCGVVPSDPV
jgi:acetylornithine deacetylase